MITVQCGKKIGDVKNFWNNIHFHPTDAIEDDWGQAILNDVAKDHVAQTVRMYAMLEDIVTMDDQGVLHYDYTLNDTRIDYMISKGFDLLLDYNFTPPCIASDPEQLRSASKNKTRYKGKMINTSKPRDFGLWQEICYQYTKHIVEKYGLERVTSWHLQCYNEPDLGGFYMRDATDEERLAGYIELYRNFALGVGRVSEKLRVGGPVLAHKTEFFDGFLKAVKEIPMKLDYISFHTYGTNPTLLNRGEKPFNARNTLEKHLVLQGIVRKYYPEGIPIFVDEWGASSHGYHNIEECPALIFREKSDYAAYMGKMVTLYIKEKAEVDKMMICLSGQHEMVVNFSGFRNLFTMDHIAKPIYNAYKMMSNLGNEVLESSGDTDEISVLATRGNGKIDVLLSRAPENFDREPKPEKVYVRLEGLAGRAKVRVYLIDRFHTNPYEKFIREGLTEPLTETDKAVLREEGTLKCAEEFVLPADGPKEIGIETDGCALALAEIEPIAE